MGIIELIKNEVLNNNEKATIIPINCLDVIKSDIKDLKKNQKLNNFQNFIIDNIYSFEIPKINFEITSIIIIASPSAPVNLIFNYKKQKISCTLPPAYMDNATKPIEIEKKLNDFLKNKEFYVKYAASLPRKLLAVRSGLATYGRNNICYVNGLGSFVNIIPLFSNIQSNEDKVFDINCMKQCQNCNICINNCPTLAIKSDTFLIDNEKCLTYFNESGNDIKFPDWISPLSHNSIYGCYICQEVCPVNKINVEQKIQLIEFSEEETLILLEGKSKLQFSKKLKEKIKILNMEEYINALPRNLNALIKKEKLIQLRHCNERRKAPPLN